jgi:hypothetical protein
MVLSAAQLIMPLEFVSPDEVIEDTVLVKKMSELVIEDFQAHLTVCNGKGSAKFGESHGEGWCL